MLLSVLFLVLSLAMILLAAEGFTNGVEVFGRRFSFSKAVVGSILAAVGTALPETILPFVAIFFSHVDAAKEIGVGAILGAPFMLSTIAFFLVGMTAVVGHLRHRRDIMIHIEPQTLIRDLSFFIVMYTASIFLPLAFGRAVIVPLAVCLLAGYGYYVYLTVKGESGELEHLDGLHLLNLRNKLRRAKRSDPGTGLVVFQIALALVLMVAGARFFVKNLSVVSLRLGMDPLLFALLLAPIATELPEKFNSVTWMWKKKDALAVGNISGAMVFQATFPVSVGLMFTPWKIGGLALVSAVMALASTCLVLASLRLKKRLPPWALLAGGAFYAAYAALLIIERHR